MATPTESEIQTAIKNAIHVVETLRESVQTGGASSLITLLATFEQSLKGDASGAALAGMGVVSEALAAGISPTNLRPIIDPLWCDYARLLGYEEREAEAIVDRLYEEFDSNSKSVKTRAITYGTPTFSGATGDGTIHRITVDGYNRNIESLASLPAGGDSKSAVCVRDQAYVSRHQESSSAATPLRSPGSSVLALD